MITGSSALERWKKHPRRLDPIFLLASPLRRFFAARNVERERKRLLFPPIDIQGVQILVSKEFRASCDEARGRTLLDAGRLANLWNLARMAGDGCFLEVGSYKGGGALHICNAVRERAPRFFCFDPFEDGGFEKLGSDDKLFSREQFTDTSYLEVVRLLSPYPHASAIKGFFPAAAQGLDLKSIAFCHLDVDVHDATRDCLEFLAGRLAPRSLIVLDDMNRNGAEGAQKAVEEFLTRHTEFMLIPMFPSQAVLFSLRLWT